MKEIQRWVRLGYINEQEGLRFGRVWSNSWPEWRIENAERSKWWTPCLNVALSIDFFMTTPAQ